MNRILHRFGAALVAGMTLLTPAWAKQRNFALPIYQVNPGTVVEVPLTLDNAAGLAGLKVQVNFDPEVLTLETVTNNGKLGQAFEMSYGKGEGFVRLTFARAAALGAGSGRLASLKFRANSGATAAAVSELAIADVRIIDATGVIDLRRKDTLITGNGRLVVTDQLVNNPKVELPDWWAENPTLTASPTTNGTISGLASDGNYSKGQTVKLTAVPVAGYWFTGWTGDASGATNPLSLLLDRNKTIGAKFAPILSNLTLSSGRLSPEFAAATSYYSVSVSHATKALKLKPTLSTPNGTVKINGVAVVSGTESSTIPLAVGQTTITVLAAAKAGAAKTYTIKVTRASSAEKPTLTASPTTHGTISGLASDGNYSKGQTVELTAVPAAGYWFAGWTGDASGATNPLSLLLDRNKTIGAKFAPILSNLTLSSGRLSPEFAAATSYYSVSVSHATKALKLTPTLGSPNGAVTINGVAVVSGTESSTIPLAVGRTTITVIAAAKGGAEKAYTIKVTRASSAELSGLEVKAATLSPKFKPAKKRYAATVAHSTESVRIKATAANDSARIKINGLAVKSGALSTKLPLKVGKNVIKIRVRTKDGTSKTYKITIKRKKSHPSSRPYRWTLAAAPDQWSLAPPNAVVSQTRVDGKRYLQITVQQNPGTRKPVVEVSPDLVDWFSGNRHTTTIIDDGRLLIVRDNTPVQPGEKRFIRVRK